MAEDEELGVLGRKPCECRAQALLESKGLFPRAVRDRVRDLVVSERNHRRDVAYQSVLTNDDDTYYLYRQGALKKFVMSVLWLELDSVDSEDDETVDEDADDNDEAVTLDALDSVFVTEDNEDKVLELGDVDKLDSLRLETLKLLEDEVSSKLAIITPPDAAGTLVSVAKSKIVGLRSTPPRTSVKINWYRR